MFIRDRLDTVWKVSVFLERIDRMEATLLAELGDVDTRELTRAIDEVRDVIERRRVEIEAELESGPPRWTDGPAEAFCTQETGSYDLSISTTWGSLAEDWTSYGDTELALIMEDESILLETVGATAGTGEDGPILLAGGWTPDGAQILLYFWLGDSAIAPGPVEVDLIHAAGNLYILEPDAADWAYGGELGGTLVFTEAAAERAPSSPPWTAGSTSGAADQRPVHTRPTFAAPGRMHNVRRDSNATENVMAPPPARLCRSGPPLPPMGCHPGPDAPAG